MRLACYGWVSERAGSVASAGYLALRELLRRGLRIDLYAHRQHVSCPEDLVGERFRYFGLEQPSVLTLIDTLPPRLVTGTRWLFSPAVAAAWRRTYRPVVEAEHRRSPYDAVFALGTTPAFTIHGVPTVAWLQAPLHTELDAIRRLRRQIVSLSGRGFYLALVTFYRYNLFVGRRTLASSDRLILPSEWSRRAVLDTGVSAQKVQAVPYPIDLELFRPEPTRDVDWERPLLLSLGRLDPRKRLDLLLEAFGFVREAFPGARLRIVGHPGYAPNQLMWLERSAHRDQIEYRAAVAREQVPSLLREAAVLVQPSENENFGSAVAEALACGVPAVVGPSNGTADYVDGNSGVFEAYEPESLARTVVRTLEARRDRSDEVRHSTRASAERWFAPPAVADRLLEIVHAAVQKT
jgi:glycosyltransferase involved in cell wall biosynthesis